MNRALIKSFVFFVLLNYSCSLEEEFNERQEEQQIDNSSFTSFDDTLIPDDFNFATSKEISVNLTAPPFLANAVFNLANITFEGDTIQVLRGNLNAQASFSQQLTVSKFTDKLVLRSEYLGLPDDVEILVTGDEANLDFNEFFSLNNDAGKQASSLSRSVAKDPFTDGDFTFLDTYDNLGVPDNVASVETITQDFLSDINAAIPENGNVPLNNPEYLNGTETKIVLTDQADVSITFLGEGAGYRNSFGYYAYDLGSAPQSVNEVVHNIVFANTSQVGSGGGLVPGTKVNIGSFPANTVIEWFIVADGWRNGSVSQSRQRYYSNSNFNPESTPDKQKHMILLHDEERDRMVMGFEDLNRDVNSDDDFNDVLFYAEVSPTNLDLSSIAKLNENPDSDGDGIIDALDEFPNDPNYAFVNYLPGAERTGKIGFEDLWPYRGDDDFNDMIVSYNYEIITNSDNLVTRMIAHFEITNIGGSFENAFGFTLPIAPSSIASISNQLLNGRFHQTAPNGTELDSNPDESIIFVVGNALHEEGRKFDIDVVFTAPMTLASLGDIPYNPFLVVQQDRAREIHLPNWPPTSKGGYFGEGADATDPANGVYYKTFRNVPWVINIYDGFTIVPEGIRIYNVYPRFLYWANSNGQQDQDWYLNPVIQ